jgi:hypothetical protein
MWERIPAAVVLLFCLVIPVAGCSSVAEVSQVDLAQIVERDGIAFSAEAIPAQVLDRLAAHRLIVVGETHFLREHQEWMVDLLRSLHARGFRQLLLEWPQMADWLVADYLAGGQIRPDWSPPTWGMAAMIAPIREVNKTLPAGEQIQVRNIDVNLSDYGGARDFLGLLGWLSVHLGSPEQLQAAIQGGFQNEASHTQKLETLRDRLASERSQLTTSWGSDWYDTITEMVEVELASARIRGIRNSDYDRSVREREEEMKRLTDLRLLGYEHGSVLNIGGNHAQKSYLKGTKQEWLGDYLVHRSTAVGGSVVVVAVTAARMTGGGHPDFTLEASPSNELFRVMNETWPGQIVFLPLDDSVFATGGVPMNFEETIYVGTPKRVYDAFLQFPLAHRVIPASSPSPETDQ